MLEIDSQGCIAAPRGNENRFRAAHREGDFDVSLYKPEKIDPQTPHARDELYVIASGSGKFFCAGETNPLPQPVMCFS